VSKRLTIIAFFGAGIGLVFLSFFVAPAHYSGAQGVSQLKEDLNQQLDDVQRQIEVYRGQIKQKSADARSLKRDIGILDDRIAQGDLELRQTDLAIKKLDLVIEEREKEIAKVDEGLNQKKNLLAEYLRTINDYDQKSLSEILLSNQNFSDFFNEIQSLEEIQDTIKVGFQEILSLKNKLEEKKSVLDQERRQQDDLRNLQQLQQRSYQNEKDRKKDLLAKTKGQESIFSSLIKRAYSDSASIKNQLYLLEGVGLSMTIEEALFHAEQAGEKTGVRPAYLLAVLKEESSWGTNVGTGSWRADMHERDHRAFLAICRKLKVDPNKMPVSRKPSYGWGGAMGPAQFLPSTWLDLEAEIIRATGHNPPNPWDIDDAFVAAGLKLAKNGANLGVPDAEWKAAMIYFAGNNWNNPLYRFYGDSVMDLAETIQWQIDAIRGK
jgi:peptidoglycan hydrolase CwlO-like protein